MKRYFLTGTDTDAGKTLISAALLQRAASEGLSCFGLKPIASGSDRTPQGLRNRDALLHQQYSSSQQDYATHNPVTLEPAIAPHIAAAQAGIHLTCDSLVTACQSGLEHSVDFQLVEGAGGWLVPLNDDETLADFATQLNASIILVVGIRLGCINHACLSVQAIRQNGLNIAGWVANGIDPDMEAQADNLNYLDQWFDREKIPCLGKIPHIADINPFDPHSLQQVSERLHLPSLPSRQFPGER